MLLVFAIAVAAFFVACYVGYHFWREYRGRRRAKREHALRVEASVVKGDETKEEYRRRVAEKREALEKQG